VDPLQSQERIASNCYRVEVSGWDASDAYFVEKTTLDWSGGDEKEINVKPPLREGSIVFVRLLQQFGSVDSFPIAYRASSVRAGENGRTLVQIERLHPREPFRDRPGDAEESTQSKVA
jgi:hypothetical protein